MKVSLRWLQDHIKLSVTPKELFDRLTVAGVEVESVHVRGVESPHVVVARIASSKPHPNADRLRVCQVEDGQGTRQVVCGAKNYKDGDIVPLAMPGAKLPGDFVIKESKLRGELSQGMLCSAKELNLAEDSEGLLILPADAPVGKRLDQYLSGDTIFEIEVTPNRPDLLSYRGLAREISAIGVGELVPSTDKAVVYPGNDSGWKVSLDAAAAAPFYSATLLTGVKVGPSPDWLKSKIEAAGHRPINNVVDITNLVLWETGQPLHAFDAARLAGKSIGARFARTDETLVALDGKSYPLKTEDLVIVDGSGPVALAGIMGGAPTGVTETTTDVLLESAWFAPGVVRSGSRRNALSSDSSYRFERRVDPAGVALARDKAVTLLQELAGAQVAGKPAEAGTLPVVQGPVTLRAARIGAVLGYPVTGEQVDTWLKRLGLQKTGGDAVATTWQAPSFRPDLVTEIDLIEEIARLHGLDNVEGRLSPGVSPKSPADLSHERLGLLRNGLAARGWNECVSDTLIDGKLVNGAAVALGNPLTEQYTHLRPSLQVSLLTAAARNLSRGNSPVRLFEVGRVFNSVEGEIQEFKHLGIVVAGQDAPGSWFERERPADYFDLKQAVDWLEERLQLRGEDLITVETVKPEALKEYGIKARAFYAEYRIEGWLKRVDVPARYKPLPAYPSVRRDLALVVDNDVRHGSVMAAIHELAIPELEDAQLFDIFLDPKGEKIPADKKSLAYALTYRSGERTLTEKEVSDWQEKVRRALQAAFSCSFRDS